MTARRPIAAVVGPARCSEGIEAIAESLGAALVGEGFRVVTGGLSGVMAAASRGARGSARYQPGDVIGILPTYSDEAANPWVDIPICTGLQHARNVLVVATGQVVLAVGGQAGTLSEIALAWKLGRPVICVDGGGGWASELAGRALDARRSDQLHGPCTPAAAAALARSLVEVGTTPSTEFG